MHATGDAHSVQRVVSVHPRFRTRLHDDRAAQRDAIAEDSPAEEDDVGACLGPPAVQAEL
jgi:hypothetical protein